MKLHVLAMLFLLGMTMYACSDDDDDDVCDTMDITYSNTIASIMNSSCAVAGCHVNGNEPNAWFSLEGYDNAKGAADFGRLVGAVSHESGFSPMPKGSDKLDPCTIDQIAAWVADGAPQ